MTPAELQGWRKTQGLSQAALAGILGVDEMTVSRWERGKPAIPPYLHLALLAAACPACTAKRIAYFTRDRAERTLATHPPRID